ncbi:MAG: amidohydrolase family protein [Anaerolineae bacterium]|nr:amidohydrolase family protein [Anaerolineae bacterium]
MRADRTMIIDCHVHIGTILTFDMPEAMLLGSMDRYGVDFALVSNIEGCEVDGQQRPIPRERQFSQRAVAEKTLRLVRAHPDRLGALLWVKPATEGCTPDFEALVADNLDVVHGLKVHPYLSNVSFLSPEVAPYIRLAERHGLVVVTHTASDPESHPRAVAEVARRQPAVNIIMYHMGIAVDAEDVIPLLAALPNLYADCCWAAPDKVRQAVLTCGADKVLFGTDNPINGPDTYADPTFYRPYFAGAPEGFSADDYDKFMFRNAIRLFKLRRFEGR